MIVAEVAVLDELLSFSPDAVLIIDDRGQILRVNLITEQLFGYGPGQLAGKSLETLLPERFRESHAAHLVAYCAKPYRRQMGSGLELWGRRRDGGEFPLDIMLAPVNADDGTNVLAIVRDITDHKRAERALRESAERYRIVAESASDAIVTIDRESKIQFANHASEKVFGYSIDEMLGQKLTMLMPERLRKVHEDSILRYLETGQKHITWNAVELPGLRKGGEEFSMEVSFGEVVDDGVHLFTGVIRDITERKEAQELLEASRKQLRHLAARLQSTREAERTRIAREIHDELGQMLTALKFELSRLKSGISGAEALKTMESTLELVDATIETVQRIATDLRPSVLDDIGLRPAIESQALEFQRRTDIDCEMDLGSQGNVLDRERSTAIFRIFQELLTNVARHAGATRARVSLVESMSEIILEVDDDGRGITENEIDNPTSLGLLGMRERAHVFGGEIRIQRAEKGGTVVRVRIPLAS